MKHLEPFAQPTFLLSIAGAGSNPVSRLGGAPNFPPSMEWPVWNDQPLPFVAQLDLTEFPVHSGIGLPASGCLFFFYEGGNQAWGFDPADQGAHAVVYVPEISLKDLPLRPLPPGIDESFHFNPAAVRFQALSESFPEADDVEFKNHNLSDEDRNEHFNHVQALREGRSDWNVRIGGYADRIQGDPRVDAQYASNGFFCGDPEGHHKAAASGLDDGIRDWQLLLQVDSVEQAGMMWGDAGMLYFLIRRQDLAAERFDRTWLVFQCC